jgi:hypothetical protein
MIIAFPTANSLAYRAGGLTDFGECRHCFLPSYRLRCIEAMGNLIGHVTGFIKSGDGVA